MHEKLTQIDGGDTGKSGNLVFPYVKIVYALGEPNVQDDEFKVDASWGVQHDDGRKLFVWNYKNGPNYTGEGRIEDVQEWSWDGDKSLLDELFHTG